MLVLIEAFFPNLSVRLSNGSGRFTVLLITAVSFSSLAQHKGMHLHGRNEAALWFCGSSCLESASRY